MNKEVLYDIELFIAQEQISIAPFAGTALFQKDNELVKFFEGQYFALEKLRRFVSDKYIKQVQKEEAEE